MICPVCQKTMVSKDFGGVQVEECSNGCHGLWFDWGEIKKLDQKNQGFGQALQVALNYPRYNDANRPPLKCPKCSVVMHQHLFESAKEINVDECYQCGGFFLDSGELRVIRDKFMSEAERAAYQENLLAQIPDHVNGDDELQKANERTDAIRQYTKFLRASYYATGK
jgi:uncharacterized protein